MNPAAEPVIMKAEQLNAIQWRIVYFDALSPFDLYAIIRLRNAVFVVEQNCVFQDADDKDMGCYHLMGWAGTTLAAYSRIVPPGLIYTEASIGRVITDAGWRGNGLGRLLMEVSLQETGKLFGEVPVRIGAQHHLTRFYASLGFVTDGDVYLEDGIPHIEMRLGK
jgi:ElaA protein